MGFKFNLKQKDIIKILNKLKAEPKIDNSGNITCKTVCHNGIGNGSHKLIYYDNSKLFVCYTGCSEDSFGIIKLIQKVLNCDYGNALSFIEKTTGVILDYIDSSVGFEDIDNELENLDLEYIKQEEKYYEDFTINSYNEKLLNNFYELYHKSFIDDNISVKTMKKYGLRFDIEKNRIIIPHYFDDKLVAIRCRNLNKDIVDKGLKYSPIKMEVEVEDLDKNCKKMVKKPIVTKTGAYIYGVPMVRETIKEHKMVILFEAEKSPMQMYTYFGDKSCALATMGSFLSTKQIEIIQELGVEEVVVAFDKEFKKYGDEEDKLYRKKLRKRVIEKLLPYFKVSIIYDKWDLLDYKDSPSDKGKKIFSELFSKRFYIKG